MNDAATVLGVIPARYRSSRFPGKALARLNGKPMIQWVYERAKRILPEVIVATDDRRIEQAVTAFKGRVMMTPRSCRSGSDRVYVVSQKRRFPFLLNIQGDEPLIKPSTIKKTVDCGLARKAVATAATKLDQAELDDPHIVKVVLGEDQRALTFSRCPVPLSHKHIGIYFYPKNILKKFVAWPQAPIEKEEKLEQLRLMSHDQAIYVAKVTDTTVGVDTPGDLKRVQKMLRRPQ